MQHGLVSALIMNSNSDEKTLIAPPHTLASIHDSKMNPSHVPLMFIFAAVYDPQ